MSNIKNKNKIEKYMSEIDKVYKTWLVYMVIDPDDRRLATTDDERSALLDSARKRTKLTDLRKQKVAARIESMGLDMVVAAIKNISKSDFHRGDNDNNWAAKLEWVCKSDEKIEEWANK